MNLLRPAFDAAWSQLLGTPLAITVAQRDAFWELLVPANAQTKAGRSRFTATAHALREPLRREINTVKHQIKDGRFDGEIIVIPGKPPIDLAALHRAYATRLTDILLRIDNAMRANGQYCLPGDEAYAQPIQVIVANERAADRPAGTSNWTQWEDPATVRKMTRIFAEAPKAKRGANWSPYMPDGTRRRGAAAELKAVKLWRGAFHDAINGPLQALVGNPDAWPLVKFYQDLKGSRIQQHIEDAIQAQTAAHKSPANPAFKANIWLALDQGTRAALAAEFHAALLQCRETLLAARNPAAAEFNPAIVPNPWALTEEETEFRQPAAPFNTTLNETEPEPEQPSMFTRPRSYDTPASGPLSDYLNDL